MPRKSQTANDAVPRQSQRAKRPAPLPGPAEESIKRKRRTPEEIQRDREEKEAQKAEKARRAQENLQRIADLENQMAAEDATNNQVMLPIPRHLQRTYSVHNLDTEEYMPREASEEPASVQGDRNREVTLTADGPQKKKAKPLVRASIQAIRQGSVTSNVGEGMAVDAKNAAPKAGPDSHARGSTISTKGPDAHLTAKDLATNVKKWATGVEHTAPQVSSRSKFLYSGHQITHSTNTSCTLVGPETIHEDEQLDDPDVTPKAKKVFYDGIMATPGGLDNEDEDIERAAAMSSPIKAGERLTSSTIVSIKTARKDVLKSTGTAETVAAVKKRTKPFEDEDKMNESTTKTDQRRTSMGIVKVEANNAVEIDEKPLVKRAKSSAVKLTNKDLPVGANNNKMYRRHFVPTYIRFAGGYEKCWNVPDADAIPALQKIWNVIYGSKLPYTVVLNDAVFQTCTQRLYDWRSGFGSVALAVVNSFFNSEINGALFKSFDKRKEYAEYQLEHLRFLYSDAEDDDPNMFRGVFRSTWILQTFSNHFSFAEGFVKVLPLKHSESPRAALALTAAAVERAFKLWATDQFFVKKDKNGNSVLKLKEVTNSGTGKMSTKSHEFSEANWGPTSQSYLRSIRNLSDDTMDDIVSKAQPFVRSNQKGESNSMDAPCDDDDDDNERAKLIDI